MNGIYHLLDILPIWLSFTLLYFLFIGILHAGREKYERLAYNVAWSSQYGDIALIIVVLIPATILQNYHINVSWFAGWIYQVECGVVGIFLGFFTNFFLLQAKEVMDKYHNLFIVPAFTFLLLTMLPITFVFGSLFQKSLSIVLLLVWLLLVIAEQKTGRINQRQWLLESGVMW